VIVKISFPWLKLKFTGVLLESFLLLGKYTVVSGLEYEFAVTIIQTVLSFFLLCVCFMRKKYT